MKRSMLSLFPGLHTISSSKAGRISGIGVVLGCPLSFAGSTLFPKEHIFLLW